MKQRRFSHKTFYGQKAASGMGLHIRLGGGAEKGSKIYTKKIKRYGSVSLDAERNSGRNEAANVFNGKLLCQCERRMRGG
jgi:hypothetical protein